MNVWFGTTTAKWSQYKKYYFKIRNHLREKNCNVLYDWLELANKEYKTNYQRNIPEIFKEVLNAIDKCDCVVIEYTVPNFSSSHQINYALLKKKPVLVLRLKKDNPHYSGSYLEALQSPKLIIKDYTLKNIESIINEFLGDSVNEGVQQRYNIVLGQKHKQYLDWASLKYNQSRSEIIKSLIENKFKDDENYKKYLNIN